MFMMKEAAIENDAAEAATFRGGMRAKVVCQ
jgi:hypothetical protein